MRTIPAIFKDGAAYPESMPDLRFGNYFDGQNYFYFESEQERDAWKAEQDGAVQVPLEDENMKPDKLSAMFDIMLENLTSQQISKLKNKLK